MSTNNLHNALGGNTADQLRAYVHRIERLEGEIKGLQDDKGEIYREAKGIGLDKKTLRMLIRRRALDNNERAEADDLLELYEMAMMTGETDPLE